MKTALFLNGVYDSVLQDIMSAQEKRGGGESFLQPYKAAVIKMLKRSTPHPESPIRLFISVTHSLKNISYVAELVGWEDKRQISEERRNKVVSYLREWQEGEIKHFTGTGEMSEAAVNLLTIRNLIHCESLPSTSILRKTSDGLSLKPRTRSGGWSEVYDDVGESVFLRAEPRRRYEKELEDEISASQRSSTQDRQLRLKNSPKIPERVQIVSMSFRRNPDVIVEVLNRANGICEGCKLPAPFLRKSDRTPFLEVHHWKPLSDGGEDVVANAGALCPNCHRAAHFG